MNDEKFVRVMVSEWCTRFTLAVVAAALEENNRKEDTETRAIQSCVVTKGGLLIPRVIRQSRSIPVPNVDADFER